jgi:pSer/pThr/pTyr-binding forkhead associated (FHA) protein
MMPSQSQSGIVELTVPAKPIGVVFIEDATPARLIILTEASRLIRVGRHNLSDLRLNSPLVAPRHLDFVLTPVNADSDDPETNRGYVCEVMDVGSSNGTTVNGSQLIANTKVRLHGPSVIDVGGVRLCYEPLWSGRT